MPAWSAGHAYELADTKYYDPSFEWSKANIPFIPLQFVILPKKGMAEQLKTIKTLLKDTKIVVSVGDPDREGNLLIDEILEELKWKGVTQRIFIYGQDDKSVIKAISDIKNNSDYACWTEAARLRSRIDWLAGINHTVALTVFARTIGFSSLLTVGRVQTPLLNMQAMQVEIQRQRLKFEMRNAHMLATLLGIFTEQDNNQIHLNLDTPRAAGK